MLTLLLLLAAGPPAGVTAPAAAEIVVTAKRDKCFVEYGQHPVNNAQLENLSRSWAAGTPVRVIEPRGASIRCEFQIMKYLARHGSHMAEFVARSEDTTTPDDAPPKSAVADVAPAKPAPPERRSVDQIVRAEHPPVPFGVRGLGAAPPSGRKRRETATAVGGRQISLVCAMRDPAKPYELDVEIDEARGTATPFRPDTGGGGEMKADFMPQAVRFGPFTIDRATLRIERENGGTAADGPPQVDGQCRLATRSRIF